MRVRERERPAGLNVPRSNEDRTAFTRNAWFNPDISTTGLSVTNPRSVLLSCCRSCPAVTPRLLSSSISREAALDSEDREDKRVFTLKFTYPVMQEERTW